MIFNIHFLPARYGDCIWIEYGEEESLRYVLIDGGTAGTRKEIKRKLSVQPEGTEFELVVVTHIDRDHIEGILELLEEMEAPFPAKDFWFNGWRHLPKEDIEGFGAEQGERLSAAILRHRLKWNDAFSGDAVVIPENDEEMEIELAGGLKLTLLSPPSAGLKKLRRKWEEELVTKSLEPGFVEEIVDSTESEFERFGVSVPDIEALLLEPFQEDTAAANGSSIAFLAGFYDKLVLFTGDAYPTTILNSLNKRFDEKVKLDLVKMSHHGSPGNTSPALLAKIDCSRFVISTNGSLYKHPSQVTLARILESQAHDVEFIFNYKSEINKVWDNAGLKNQYGYTTTYPVVGEEGIELRLLD